MITILVNIGLLLCVAAVALSFIARRWSAAVAAGGLVLIYFGASDVTVNVFTLVMWIFAAAVAVALGYVLPARVAASRRGVGYVAAGALTGAVLGALIDQSWLVLGTIIGTIIGTMAYSFTPEGRVLKFPSSQFIQYLCAKGLPAAVTISIAAVATFIAVTAYTL